MGSNPQLYMYLPELKGSKGVFFKFDGFPGTCANEGPVQELRIIFQIHTPKILYL